MARARNIKPGFFKNEILGAADPLYSLLFEGLWVLADRAGRLEDRPLRIKGEIFPYRDGLNIDGMLNWLADNGFIQRYTSNGKKCILVLEFVKHQNPHKNEAESELPAPEETSTNSEENGKTPEKIGTTRADSLSSDSLIPDSLTAEKKPAAPSGAELLFDEFWATYPRKAGKDAARKAFAKRKPSLELLNQMIQAIRDQAKTDAWRKDGGQYIPHPATWLNEGRWQDETTVDLSVQAGIDAAEATRREREARDKGAAPPPAHIRAQLASLTKKLTGAMA